MFATSTMLGSNFLPHLLQWNVILVLYPEVLGLCTYMLPTVLRSTLRLL
jgi:hypothetical protein